MGRPPKEGVDYFPHKAKHGETMFILEKHFGNDGYAAWFKILESLASKEGHYLDCSNGKPTWEYLKAKIGVEDNILAQIIDLLAKLDAIDQNLWKIKVIWSQHFCDGIADVYRKRKTETPQKPTFCDRNPSTTVVSGAESTQREEREEREKRKEYIRPFLGQFQNVKIEAEELEKLNKEFGELGAHERIENLSQYLASKGKKYKNHYATILTWERRHQGEEDGIDKFLKRHTKNSNNGGT